MKKISLQDVKYKKEHLNILFISDVHLFNRRTIIEYMVANLYKYVLNPDLFKTLDMFVISGDLLDRELTLGDYRVLIFQKFIIRLVTMCDRYNVKLRILEGTPSHDRRQPKQLNTVLSAYPGSPTLDAKYVDVLAVEQIEEWGVDILYIPDEWHTDHDIIYDQAVEAIQAKGLDKVDFAIMHGMFDYQVPDNLNLPAHNSERYGNLVTHLISIGHWHKASFHGKIIAQGSFDRISFNEEEKKGFVVSEVNLLNPTETKTTFMQNKGAKIYKNINIVGLDDLTVKKRLQEALLLPRDSFIRIEMARGTEILTVVDSFFETNRGYNWSKKFTKELSMSNSDSILPTMNKVTPINERTISSLIGIKLDAKNAAPDLKLKVLDLIMGL